MSSLKKFLILPFFDKFVLFYSILMFSILTILFPIISYKKIFILLKKISNSKDLINDNSSVETAKNISQLVKSASIRFPLKVTCLKESLTIWFLLRLLKINSDIQMGVSKTEEEFNAHAWVECQNEIINDTYSHIKNFKKFTL